MRRYLPLLSHIMENRSKSCLHRRHNSIFFVGEHTTTDYTITGTIEAAVESAERIVRIIIWVEEFYEILKGHFGSNSVARGV